MKKYNPILDEFNRTEVPFDRQRTVLDMFLDSVNAYPDNTAIIYENRHYTYREIDAITTCLACRIASEGGAPGMAASVLIPRCEYMPVIPLALLKVGMTYVPLDNTYPAERLEYIISDSDSQLIIATEAELSSIDINCKSIILPDAQNCMEIAAWDDSAKSSLHKATADNVLTILYTSGTTGNPKGTLIPHMSAIVLSDYMRRKFQLTERDIYGTYCSYGFDVCNMDLFLAMTCGAALCIVPQDIKLNLDALYRYLNNNNVSVVYFPTAIGAQYLSKYNSGKLRCLLVVGEKLLPWGRVWKDCKVYNCYGPTEAFDFNSCYLVKGDETDIPVGKPNDNTHFYILSENGDRVGIGEEGEICIAGPQVSRGYLNLPERTAQVFTPNPYAGGDYGVLYHTGDLGYYREDGNVMVIGRRDTQVKIRGNRLELKEVEAAVRLYPGVEDAVVDAKTLPSGRKVLVAYVVSGQPVPARDLCRFIGEHKPSYMIPSAVVQLDALPLNQNGKVNRKMLCIPELLADSQYVAPRNHVEEILCDAYSVTLGIGHVGIDDDLIELGGDSLSIIGILGLCNNMPGITASVLANCRTPRKISDFLEKGCQQMKVDTTPLTDYPLPGSYNYIFDYCTTTPDNTFLHEDLGIRIDKGIDVERLRQAIVKAVDNHPVMKARFGRNVEGKLRIYRNDNDEVFVSVRTALECEMEDVKKDFVRYYDLREDPPYRIEIITTESYTYLIWDIHHLVSDGVSFDILLNDISDAYMGKPLQSETWTYFDALLHDYNLIGSALYDEGKKWFENTFAGIECKKLPEPDVTNAVDSMEPGYFSIDLPIKKPELERCCAYMKTTLNILAQCAAAMTLGKYTGQEEALFVITADGRDFVETQHTMGIFSKLEPVYCKWGGNRTLSQVLQDANNMRMMCLAHRAFPFSHLSINNYFFNGAVFTNQSNIGKHPTFCGFESSVFHFRNTGINFGISMELFLHDDMETLYFGITYKKSLYTPAFIARFANDLVQRLVGFLSVNN